MNASLEMLQPFPERLKLRREFVAVDLGIDAGFGGSLLHFLAMFIEAGEKKYLASAQPPIARQHVRRDGGVGMADMRYIVDVINRGGDVKEAVLPPYRGKIPGRRRVLARLRLRQGTSPSASRRRRNVVSKAI